MPNAFKSLFWGVLLVLAYVTINGFDFLIDGLGYLLIAVGCEPLSEESSGFPNAQSLCLLLGLLWLPGFFLEGELSLYHGLVMTALKCLMIWQLLGGLRDFALTRHREDLASRAASLSVAYLAVVTFITLTSLAIGRSQNNLLALVMIVAMFTVTGMILHLIHSVRTQLFIPEHQTNQGHQEVV